MVDMIVVENLENYWINVRSRKYFIKIFFASLRWILHFEILNLVGN
jgi:hypothetical protein